MHVIKKLAGCIREYKLQTILSPLFIALEVLIEVMIPFITAKLIDSIEAQATIAEIARHGGILVLLAMLSLVCGALSGHFCAVASSGFAKNLRHDLFYKVQSYSFSNIDKFSTSSLVTRLTTDVTNVQNSFMMVIRTAIRSPMMLAFSVIMTMRISKKLTLVFLTTIPFLAVGLTFMLKKVMPFFKKIFKKYDALNNSVQENISGIRAVKSFVREDYEKQKFAKASDDVCDNFTRAEKLMALSSPLIQMAIYVVMLLICFLGAKTIITSGNTELTVGGLSSVMTYGMQVLMSLMMFTMIFVMITMSMASANRIVEVLDEDSDIKNPENPVLTVCDGSISFENVSFSYSEKSERKTLENINLNIKSGETVGVIGATGSSKTSLIQLVSRLYDVTEGSVRVGGVDVRDYDVKKLRDAVSVVLQKNVLFSGTVSENLRWGNKDATDEEIRRACILAQADDFVSAMHDGYETMIERGGTNVSGGQKQRLCIARAILKKPKILIFDDSTSAVDTKTDSLIRKALREEIPDTTKIIIAQRISSVQDADKIIVLDNGTINGIGTHDELVETNEIYREVFETQTKAGDFDD